MSSKPAQDRANAFRGGLENRTGEGKVNNGKSNPSANIQRPRRAGPGTGTENPDKGRFKK